VSALPRDQDSASVRGTRGFRRFLSEGGLVLASEDCILVMAGAMEEPAEERNGSTGVAPDLERMDGNGESNPTPVDPVQALPPGKFAKDAEEVVMAEEAAEEGGKKKPVAPKVSFFALFKYADFYDYLLMILAFFGAVGDGSSFAVMLAVLGGLINSFGNHANGTSKSEFNSKVIEASATPVAACANSSFP
jgi:hypothetical protein